jgi:hypothetical protein
LPKLPGGGFRGSGGNWGQFKRLVPGSVISTAAKHAFGQHQTRQTDFLTERNLKLQAEVRALQKELQATRTASNK